MLRRYKEIKFREKSLSIIDTVNAIIEEYTDQGYDMTLRQIYYQMVARSYIPNNQAEYNKLGSLLNDARLAGLLDWNAIIDRTRMLRQNPHWNNASEIISACADQFEIDKWKGQLYRPEVWVEKDALIGVVQSVCNRLDIPCFSCRGYTSQTEMWNASQRLLRHIKRGAIPYILHFGDHDPSGIDMSRDIEERLAMFIGPDKKNNEPFFKFERLALNWEQIQEYSPPENPAKITDSRAEKYIDRFGTSSWELDALEPSVIDDLISSFVNGIIDKDRYEKMKAQELEKKDVLVKAAERWSDVEMFLREVKP